MIVGFETVEPPPWLTTRSSESTSARFNVRATYSSNNVFISNSTGEPVAPPAEVVWESIA
jgi:hypothetical protein